MRYPTIPVRAASRDMIDAFRGYNHNLRIADGEFYDMKNMTSDFYPVLSPRERRGLLAQIPGITGIISKEKLCYTDGADFVIGEDRYEMDLNSEEKMLISMGAHVIIMPDKKYINTAKPEERGSIEAEFTTSGEVSFQLCNLSGELYEGATVADKAPENPENGALWIDTSSKPHALKKYTTATSQWISIASTYVRIGATGIGKNFEKNDGVTIEGIQDEALEDLNGTMIIWEKGDDYIVVIGLLDEASTQKEAVTVSRKMPDMDFMLESENRLWGCRYGLNREGEFVNELYACKLGDFKNWNCFMQVSTDSYAATAGTDGPFTGAIAHMGYPLFFKENCFHKVFGNYPANYQIQTTACRGVQKGSHRSMAIVNEVLYYKADTAVCSYDGSLPSEISYCLGNEHYSSAVGGGHGNKYYVSMMDMDEKWHLFVWDTAKKLWHREDDLIVGSFCSHGGQLYALCQDKRVITMLRGDGSGETDYSWYAETGEIGFNTPDQKYISQIVMRLSLETGTELRVFARYDFSEQWEPLFALRSTKLSSYEIPIRPKRCDYMKLRLEGDGPGKIYSITKKMMKGSAKV